MNIKGKAHTHIYVDDNAFKTEGQSLWISFSKCVWSLRGAFYPEGQSLLGVFYPAGQTLWGAFYPVGQSLPLTSPLKKPKKYVFPKLRYMDLF